jgi:hypothetical protein
VCCRSSVGSQACGPVVLVGVISQLPGHVVTASAISTLLPWKNHSQRGSIEQVLALWGNTWIRRQITERAAVLFLVLRSQENRNGRFLILFNQTGIRAVATRRCGHKSNHITIPLTGRGASPRRCAGHQRWGSATRAHGFRGAG